MTTTPQVPGAPKCTVCRDVGSVGEPPMCCPFCKLSALVWDAAIEGVLPEPAAAPAAGEPQEQWEPGTWYKAESVEDMQRFFRSRLPAIREAAQEHGFAIGVHGSERRDFDLIAAPWREGASDPDTLAHAISIAACGIARQGPYDWEQKPLGRVAVSMPVCWTGRHNVPSDGHIDLSVAPALAVAAGEQVKRWPFVETPGEFTQRLEAALLEFGALLPAVRNVLIENPPALAAATPSVPQTHPGETDAYIDSVVQAADAHGRMRNPATQRSLDGAKIDLGRHLRQLASSSIEPALAEDSVQRLKATIEECEGLAITDEHAKALLQYVLGNQALPSLGLHATEGRAETCDEQAAWLRDRVSSYRVDDATTIEAAQQRDGSTKWAVRRHGEVLGRGGEWEPEPLPSSRDDAFLARCRFDTAEEAALAVRQQSSGERT